jgi:glycosyltransferase involved in cell wall biosynthesis
MERKVIQLLNLLDRNAFEAHLLGLEGFYGNPGDYLEADVKTHSLRKKEGVHPGLVFTLAGILRRERVDIVHSHNWPTFFHTVLAAKLARVPVIVHGEHGRESQEVDRKWKSRLARKFLYARTDQVVTVAQDLKDIVVREFGVPPGKVKVIPNGVDLDKFENLPEAAALREKFGLPKEGPLIGTIAHLRPVKDMPTLFRAFAAVFRKRRDACLVVAGTAEAPDDPVHREVERLIREGGLEGNVRFLGQTAEAPALLSILSVYVNSSLTEGMSNTILEAMAAGVPVVATSVGGNPELVRDGENGYLFPARDDGTCALKILQLLENPGLGRDMGRRSRARVLEKHSFARMIRENEDMYRTLASGRIR